MLVWFSVGSGFVLKKKKKKKKKLIRKKEEDDLEKNTTELENSVLQRPCWDQSRLALIPV